MPRQEYFSPETLPPTRGYSQVVKVGNTVYIAGQVGITIDGNVVSKGDAAAQARQIWQNLKAAVKSAGGDLENIVKTTIYIIDMNDFGKVNEIYKEYFPQEPPARATVQVCRLPKDVKVEIDAIAYIK